MRRRKTISILIIGLVFMALLPVSLFAQRYALIDRNLKTPILFTDSVTVEQVSKGFFPIENGSIDTLIANLLYLQQMVDVRQRSKMQSFELHSSNVTISVSRVPFAYGDRYSAQMKSEASGLTARYLLIDPTIKNKRTSDKLDALLSYLSSNKSFFKEPNEIKPRVYNVVVVVD